MIIADIFSLSNLFLSFFLKQYFYLILYIKTYQPVLYHNSSTVRNFPTQGSSKKYYTKNRLKNHVIILQKSYLKFLQYIELFKITP